MWPRDCRRTARPAVPGGAPTQRAAAITGCRPRRAAGWSTVSWGLALSCALCGSGGCDSRDQQESASTTSVPTASDPAGPQGTGEHDASPPAFVHPIDQVPEGAIYRRAVTALDAGDVVGALAARRLLENHPRYVVLAEAVDALALVKKKEYDAALRAAENLSKIPALQAESYMIAGEVFHAQGKWQDALGAFHGALKLHPDLMRAHRWLGAIYYDMGAMHLAIEHLRKVAELDATDYRSPRLCGLIQHDYQQYGEAVDSYTRALERSPPEPVATEIRLGLADSLRELRRVEEALATLGACQDSAKVRSAQAACYETSGKLDEALKQALGAVELAPRDPGANHVLGRLYLSARRPADAVGPLQIACGCRPLQPRTPLPARPGTVADRAGRRG